MNQHDYQQPYQQTYEQSGATFGAEVVPVPVEGSGKISQLWDTARLCMPCWLKESVTISLGVFGGMALFRVFQRKLPREI